MLLSILTKLTIWRLASVVAFLVFIIIRLIIKASKMIDNKYYQDFHDDELIKETDTANSHNKLYFTAGETKGYIPKYILAKTDYDKYVICNYAKKYKIVKFYIVEYNARKKVIGVLEVEENYTKEASRIIAIDRSAKYVNIVVKEVDNKVINSRVIMPLSLKSIRKYSFLKSLSIFMFAFALRQGLVELYGFLAKLLPSTQLNELKVEWVQGILSKLKDLTRVFLGDNFNLYIVLGILVLSILSYVFSVVGFKKRNKARKNEKEGVVEYEFL